MTVKELREILVVYAGREDEPVSVVLALPSVGPRANTLVTNVSKGLDWDKGLLLTTSERLVPKTNQQDVFEAAFELLAFIATKPTERKTYEQRKAEKILRRYGCDDGKLDVFRRVFHKKGGGDE